MGWTLLQAFVLLTVEYQGVMAHPSARDLTREALWARYAWTFVALALLANLVLEGTALGERPWARAGVWAAVLAVVAAVAVTTAGAATVSYPLYVPFIVGAALVALVVREAVGRAVRGPQPST